MLEEVPAPSPSPLPRWLRQILTIAVPAVLAFGAVCVTAIKFELFGWTLFFLIPLLQSLLASFIYRITGPASHKRCFRISMLSIFLLGAMLLVLRVDGLICLVMALPLAAVFAGAGSFFGYQIGRCLSQRAAKSVPIIVLLAFPLFLAMEQTRPPELPLHDVTTRIAVNAPIETVWNEVIAFDRITAPPSGLFRLGIAYPIEAKIEGEGVGAIRHCIFSTGPFIEPITRWEAPCLLEFTVESNPPVLKEVSPWGHLDTEHLHSTFASERGRFRLYEEDGKTILEGTTWYRQSIAPDFYWSRISNYLIHKIHLRVLHHIQQSAETSHQQLAAPRES